MTSRCYLAQRYRQGSQSLVLIQKEVLAGCARGIKLRSGETASSHQDCSRLEILTEMRKRFGNEPYRLLTEAGDVLILPPSYAQVIRNEKGLSFSRTLESISKVIRSNIGTRLTWTRTSTAMLQDFLHLVLRTARIRFFKQSFGNSSLSL
jgi:hypothetical protein